MRWILRLIRKGRLEGELDAELRFHTEQLTADYIRAGMAADEARRRARIEFGATEQIKEECRDARGTRWVETLVRDVRYALRAATQRTSEIGIRLAPGARRADVLAMLLRQGLMLAFCGGAIGVAGTLALTRFLAGLLFEVSPNDPGTIGAVCLIFAAVAVTAVCIPALRALRIDPTLALRYE